MKELIVDLVTQFERGAITMEEAVDRLLIEAKTIKAEIKEQSETEKPVQRASART